MQEIHLFIIWSNALYKKKDILDDISNKFSICKIYNTTWSKENFSSNLTRFYGENLPKNSGKEKHCGNDTFCCVIVQDKNPVYEIRDTSKGSKVVNTKLFDAKQLYRKWSGGGHKIHATDNVYETKLQLALLFGENYDEYINDTVNSKEKEYHDDLVGANGWKSFEELFHILNLTTNYVVLRNYDNLESQLTSLHPDVDLLVENKRQVIDILNAKATTNKHYRVQYSVSIFEKKINFDLRYIGDKYYDYNWEYNILKDRVKSGYLFVPNDSNHFFSLLYHALVHKQYISRDYLDDFLKLGKMIDVKLNTSNLLEENLLGMLIEYMFKKRYNIVEPLDLTVYFNRSLLNKKINIKISKQRQQQHYYWYLRSSLKKYLFKILKKVRIV